jgi:hypothetical protein
VDFTREPIIETVITPKEGCKLVVKNSKNPGQEEYFVDAVEVVSFGHSSFFRSLEKPKHFLVPVADYEVLEVRETRVILKHAVGERAIKIGGGREALARSVKEIEKLEGEAAQPAAARAEEAPAEGRTDKKRERRRQNRRRRGKDERDEAPTEREVLPQAERVTAPPISEEQLADAASREVANIVDPMSVSRSVLSSIIIPPPTLISETIGQYKEKFKEAFFTKDEEQSKPSEEELQAGEFPSSETVAPPELPPIDISDIEHDSIFEEVHEPLDHPPYSPRSKEEEESGYASDEEHPEKQHIWDPAQEEKDQI